MKTKLGLEAAVAVAAEPRVHAAAATSSGSILEGSSIFIGGGALSVQRAGCAIYFRRGDVVDHTHCCRFLKQWRC